MVILPRPRSSFERNPSDTGQQSRLGDVSGTCAGVCLLRVIPDRPHPSVTLTSVLGYLAPSGIPFHRGCGQHHSVPATSSVLAEQRQHRAAALLADTPFAGISICRERVGRLGYLPLATLGKRGIDCVSTVDDQLRHERSSGIGQEPGLVQRPIVHLRARRSKPYIARLFETAFGTHRVVLRFAISYYRLSLSASS